VFRDRAFDDSHLAIRDSRFSRQVQSLPKNRAIEISSRSRGFSRRESCEQRSCNVSCVNENHVSSGTPTRAGVIVSQDEDHARDSTNDRVNLIGRSCFVKAAKVPDASITSSTRRLESPCERCGLIPDTRRGFSARKIERGARRDVAGGGGNEEKCLRSATLKPERVPS